jgi:hypothetical protein
MGGFVTWISIGISAVLTGYEAIIAQNPEVAGFFGVVGVALLGIGRKLEKGIKAFQGKK